MLDFVQCDVQIFGRSYLRPAMVTGKYNDIIDRHFVDL